MAEFKLPDALRNLPGMDLTPQKVQKVESIPAEELHHYAHSADCAGKGRRL